MLVWKAHSLRIFKQREKIGDMFCLMFPKVHQKSIMGKRVLSSKQDLIMMIENYKTAFD